MTGSVMSVMGALARRRLIESLNLTDITTVGPTINASTTPGSSGSGNLIAITSGAQVSVNGIVIAATAGVIELYYSGHTAYQFNGTNWYGPIISGNGGTQVVSPKPGESINGAGVTTVGPTINASPTPGSAGLGNLIGITAGAQISFNGAPIAGTAGVIELYYTGHTAYQYNGTNWYGPITATDGGTSVTTPKVVMPVFRWGVNGHRDQGGIYGTRTIAQQCADVQSIFGSTPNTVYYRAFSGAANTDLQAAITAGIIPIMGTNTYPPFPTFTSEADAYTKSYNITAADITACPAAVMWEVGNENDLEGGDPTNRPIHAQLVATGRDGRLASDWTGLAAYPKYRGAMAGSIAALRDHAPTLPIIGGALSGWTDLGLELAYAADIVAYGPQNGRNLLWDISVVHFYNDAPGGGNTEGDPANYAGGINTFTALYSTGKPILFTEFGASNVNNTANDSIAGTNITTLMASFKSHAAPVAGSQRGCLGGCIYQLYQQPGLQTDYFLYTISNGTPTIAAQGTAVKNWIIANP
jgi:hypothetical protein